MVVLPSTGASRYHNCCIDGGISPKYFGHALVYVKSGVGNSKLTGMAGSVSPFGDLENIFKNKF
jgi:hypothetical protein